MAGVCASLSGMGDRSLPAIQCQLPPKFLDKVCEKSVLKMLMPNEVGQYTGCEQTEILLAINQTLSCYSQSIMQCVNLPFF